MGTPEDVAAEKHFTPPENYTLVRANRYRITNRTTNQTYEASALSAQEACQKLGWLIGDCYVQEISKNG